MTKKSDLQDREDLARKLRLALHTREWNQSDLARAASMPRELISSYINGRAFPPTRSLRRLADALGIQNMGNIHRVPVNGPGSVDALFGFGGG